MKNIRNIFYVVMLALCSVSLAACSDEETYDFSGDPYNRVYMPDNSSSYKITQTPVGAVSTLEFETFLKCTQKATEPIRATVEIDNSLIAAYNEEHGTNYEEMPASALTIENTVMNIPVEAMVTSETLRITLSEDEDAVKKLRSQYGYLIPLCLTMTEGGNSQPSSNFSSTYLIVNIIEDKINHEAVENDISGVLVEDQTGWSATTNGTLQTSSYYYPLETLFDRNGATYSYIRHTDAINLDIDMGQSYTFDAITLYQGTSTGRLYAGTVICLSNDGVTWRSVGEITATSKVCVFYEPLTTRYIRIIRPKTGRNTTLFAGAFNIYKK